MTDDPLVTDEMLWADKMPHATEYGIIESELAAAYLAMHAARPVPEVGGDDPRIAVLANNSAPVPWAERLAGARMALAAIDAVDPLRRPVSGDRIETALGVWFAGRAWSTGDDASTLRGLMSRALSAADRGRVVVDWRRPEEFVQTRQREDHRWVLVKGRSLQSPIHWSALQLPRDSTAWAEMPAPPAWADRAATAPGHTDLMVSPEAIDAFLEKHPPPDEPYQSRVNEWLHACFAPEICADRTERNHRFLEESLELIQSGGCSASEAHQLVDYVFGRPVGEMKQEIGGVMVTLAALCLAYGEDMTEAGDVELARCWANIEKIRAKQAAKPKHSPLPETKPPAWAADQSFTGTGPDDAEFGTDEWRRDNPEATPIPPDNGAVFTREMRDLLKEIGRTWFWSDQQPSAGDVIRRERFLAAFPPAATWPPRDWQLIKTAPKDGTYIKVLLPNGTIIQNVYWCDDAARWAEGGRAFNPLLPVKARWTLMDDPAPHAGQRAGSGDA